MTTVKQFLCAPPPLRVPYVGMCVPHVGSSVAGIPVRLPLGDMSPLSLHSLSLTQPLAHHTFSMFIE